MNRYLIAATNPNKERKCKKKSIGLTTRKENVKRNLQT